MVDDAAPRLLCHDFYAEEVGGVVSVVTATRMTAFVMAGEKFFATCYPRVASRGGEHVDCQWGSSPTFLTCVHIQELC